MTDHSRHLDSRVQCSAEPDPLRQSWDCGTYGKNARFVADLGAPVLELLDGKPGERVLDVGCGDGALTLKIAAGGCEVVGVDASPELVAGARRLGVDARVMRGERLTFVNEFHAVFSNAALHWMKQADEVLSGINRALEPRGRLVAEMGAAGCVQTIRDALVEGLDARGVQGEAHVPWYFPSPDKYAERLRRAGFRVDSMRLFPRPTPLPGDIAGWLETFGESFTSALPFGERAGYLRDVRDALAPKLRDASGTWIADYTRLRFVATKVANSAVA